MRPSIVQLNLLAPFWIGKEYELLPCYDSYASVNRVHVIMDYILNSLPAPTFYCFSEASEGTILAMQRYFPDYDIYYAENGPTYWREWLRAPLEGTATPSNGNCVLVDRRVVKVMFSVKVPLGNMGCMAASVTSQTKEGYVIRVTSIHLDNGNRKMIELEALVSFLKTPTVFDVDVVSGDFNTYDIALLEKEGYENSYALLRSTTPIFFGKKGHIDHTLIKGSKSMYGYLAAIGFDDSPVWERMCKTVRTNGTDHFASWTEFSV